MRTRSQPDSPGGLVSLDDMQSTTRRTRSTRSASRAASQEPSTQQPAEPAPQTTTRTKSQQRTTKKTTSAKSASAKNKSTTSTTKPQPRTGSRRGTRSATRKADHDASEEVHESVEQNNIDTARTQDDDNTEPNSEEAVSDHPESDAALKDHPQSERMSPIPLESLLPLPPSLPPPPQPSPSHSTSPLSTLRSGQLQGSTGNIEPQPDTLPERQGNADSFQASAEADVPWESGPLDTFFDDFLADLPTVDLDGLAVENLYDFTDMLGELSPNEVEETLVLSQELSDEIDRALERAKHQRTQEILEQATPATPRADHQPTDSPAVPETSEQVDAAEPTSEEAKETEQQSVEPASEEHDTRQETVSPSASSVHSDENTVVDDTVDELAALFANMSLRKSVRFASVEATVFPEVSTTLPMVLPQTRPAPVTTTASPGEVNPALVLGDPFVTRATASIYDDAPLLMPAFNILFAAPRPVQRTTLFASPFPSGPTSIFDDEHPASRYALPERARSVEAPLAPVVLDEEPELTPGSSAPPSSIQTRRPLSPILEETDLDPACSSASPPGTTAASEAASPTPSITSSAIPPADPSPSAPRTKGTPRTLPTSVSAAGPQDAPCVHSLTVKQPKRSLTNPSKVNRKRPRAQSSPDDDAEPATPSANKRRNTGPAGSTPFARSHTLLTRRLSRIAPREQRLARRAAERDGRIHRTIFRLPEFVAQVEADRRASEAAELAAPSHSEPLNPELPLSSHEQNQADKQVANEEPAAAPAPSTPQTPRRTWKLTGIINSVPRSFARLFGRSSAGAETPAIQQPATERIGRTRTRDEAFPDADPEEESHSGRRLSEQRPAKRPRNLNYSLFPAPMDWSLYLPAEDTTTPAENPAETPAGASASAGSTALQPVQDKPQGAGSQNPSETTERRRDTAPKASSTGSLTQKRKHMRDLDVIPGPEGGGYGINEEAFYGESDSSDDEVPAPRTEPRNTVTRTALRRVTQTEGPASKKVRFDASPDDTPSKLRARALPRASDPYTGRHFIGMGNPQPAAAPATPTPTRPTPAFEPHYMSRTPGMTDEEYARQRELDEIHAAREAARRAEPGFRYNHAGTFQLDYDAFSDESDSSGPESPSSIPAPTTPLVPQSVQPPTPRPTAGPAQAAQPAQTPSTLAKVDEEALARARSQAEKYKPKTPSGLRTASRYSSPLTAVTPATPATPELTPAPAESIVEHFGDDHFAEDAQWLYDICPSGDLRQLVWPETMPFNDGLNVGPEPLRIVNDIWDSAEADTAHDIFQREFAEFKKTLA